MDNDIIWAAGFIDGEGCITISRIRYKAKDRWYYKAHISCGQTIKGRVAIEKLRTLFGGYVYEYHQVGNKLPTLTWSVRSKAAREVAEKLIPYLVLKKPQAQLMLQLLTRNERKLNHELTDEELNDRRVIYEQMRNLNAIGLEYQKRLSEETAKAEATV